LRDPIRAACRDINRLRIDANAFVFAADLPTGLDADSGKPDADCVVADIVVTIGFAKRGLIADAALEHVGRIEVAPLQQVAAPADSRDATVATPASLRHLVPRRAFSGYKNKFGRVGVVAGSRGLTGAAVLCALGAMRGGAGLLRVYVLEDIYPIVAASAPPRR
jgi:NAD(P)H-hydrate epimerase